MGLVDASLLGSSSPPGSIFNAKTISAYEACFNTADPSLTCQQAHDDCYIAQL